MTDADSEAAIREVIERRVVATRSKDPDGASEAFTDDVLTFDVVDPLQHVGKQSVKERAREWFTSFDGPVGYEVRDLTVRASADVGFAHCLYRVSGRLQSGGELGMWNRATFCFQHLDGEWKIVHEHDSVPFDPTSGQASVGLEPT